MNFSPIGGEMEVSAEALAAAHAAPPWQPPDGWRTVACGRTALRLILRTIKERLRSGVLLPAYVCDSVLQPFREEGIPIAFYDGGPGIRTDPAHVRDAVARHGPAALLFVNYFGFPVEASLHELLLDLGRQCLLLEDCVQGSLIEPTAPIVGQTGHYVFTSFRKYLPLPDGGVAGCTTGEALPSLPAGEERFVRYRLMGKLLRSDYLRDRYRLAGCERAYLALFTAAEDDLSTATPLTAMSAVSAGLLAGIALGEVAARRRANFSALRSALACRELQGVIEPVFEELPPHVSPLVFPVRVLSGDRDALRTALALRRVYCPIHWPMPVAALQADFPVAAALSAEILSVPLDQRYEPRHMESVVERLLAAWASVRAR